MSRRTEAEQRLVEAIAEALRKTYTGGSDSLQDIAKFLIIERTEQVHDLRAALNEYKLQLEVEERFGVQA